MGLALALAAPLAAAPPFGADARVELLGVLQQLSGTRPELPADPVYRQAVEQAFAAHRGHPAVALYRQESERPGGESLGIALQYYTDPPELARADPAHEPPYLSDEAAAARFQKTLRALRAFSEDARFREFFESRRADYARAAEAARRELGVDDPLERVERYLGLSLECRARWIVSPLYVPARRGSFIIPYPDPATLPAPGEEPFRVVTLLAYAPGARAAGTHVTQRHRAALWQEPLFVFVDPAMAAFDRSLGARASAFYGAGPSSCRRRDADCVKSWVVQALSRRLDVQAFGRASAGPDGGDPERERWVARLDARLEEYERDRARWPTLWDFWPRLMAVFAEAEGRAVPALGERPRVSRVKQLFPGEAK